MEQAKKRQRAPQQRAEDTREAILQAGIDLFSTQGYDGISIRAIEAASKTKRGLVSYHFGSKENLWKAVAERVFENLPVASEETLATIRDLDRRAQIRAHLTNFVRYSAKHPEISRLIIQEGKSASWRLEHLVDNYVRPRVQHINELMGGELDAHTLYIFIGAATLIFDVEAECERMFGFNPREDEFVREHARRLCDLMIDTF